MLVMFFSFPLLFPFLFPFLSPFLLFSFPWGWESPCSALTARLHLAACRDRRAASLAEQERWHQAKSGRNKPKGRDSSGRITFTFGFPKCLSPVATSGCFAGPAGLQVPPHGLQHPLPTAPLPRDPFFP